MGQKKKRRRNQKRNFKIILTNEKKQNIKNFGMQWKHCIERIITLNAWTGMKKDLNKPAKLPP